MRKRRDRWYRIRFFVHCTGWKDGGYTNVHYERDVEEWKRFHLDSSRPNRITVLSIEEVTAKEFAEDFIGGMML